MGQSLEFSKQRVLVLILGLSVASEKMVHKMAVGEEGTIHRSIYRMTERMKLTKCVVFNTREKPLVLLQLTPVLPRELLPLWVLP